MTVTVDIPVKTLCISGSYAGETNRVLVFLPQLANELQLTHEPQLANDAVNYAVDWTVGFPVSYDAQTKYRPVNASRHHQCVGPWGCC